MLYTKDPFEDLLNDAVYKGLEMGLAEGEQAS